MIGFIEEVSAWTPLQHVQVAYDGNWEEALQFPPGQSATRTAQRLSAAAAANSNIAVEAFYGTQHPGFIGVRLTAGQVVLAHRVIVTLLKTTTGAGGLDVLRAELDARLFGMPASSVDLGVVNRWRSIGSLGIWRAGPDSGDVREALRMLDTWCPWAAFDQPLVCEIASEEPQEHWLAVPIRERPDGVRGRDMSHLLSIIERVHPATPE